MHLPSLRVAFSKRYGALVIIAVIITSGCRNEEVDPRIQRPLVETAVVASSERDGPRYPGTVVARVESALGFRVGGKIVERLVDPGEVVTKGQPLMRLDPRDYELSQVATDGTVAAARATALQAQENEARARSLVASGAVSRTVYDQMKASADSAVANLASAEARAHVARNEASYTTLTANASGVVTDTLAEPGQIVSVGQPVIRLAVAGAREARVSLPENGLLPVGTEARVRLFAGRAVTSAKLRQISGQADRQTRTYDARFTLSGDAAVAPLGASLTVELPISESERKFLVPFGAVVDRGGGPGVWVVELHKGHSQDEAIVRWRPVVVGPVDSETATVLDGLSAGDRIVALGAQLLHDGDRVRLQPRTSLKVEK